jgi:hypothetical protein
LLEKENTMTARVIIPKISYCKLPPDTLGEWRAPKGIHPAVPGTIAIDARLKGKLKMEVLIHELLHEFHPDLSEESVELTGNLIAEALHQQGFRETRE